MQYKVPQNIDLEDKIVGPFTMKQFIYLLASGGIVYGWWNYLSKSYVDFIVAFLILAIPVGMLGVALALIKVNDRPFEYFLLNVFKFIFTPKRRVWQEGFKSEPVIVSTPGDEVKAPTVVKDTRSLDDLSRGLEKQSEELRKKAIAEAPEKKGFLSRLFKPEENAASKQAPALNISVKDIKSASEKQTGAQLKN